MQCKRGAKLTNADGLSGRPYDDTEITVDEAEVSFIDQINTDVFDADLNVKTKGSEEKKSYTLIELSYDNVGGVNNEVPGCDETVNALVDVTEVV